MPVVSALLLYAVVHCTERNPEDLAALPKGREGEREKEETDVSMSR